MNLKIFNFIFAFYQRWYCEVFRESPVATSFFLSSLFESLDPIKEFNQHTHTHGKDKNLIHLGNITLLKTQDKSE